MTDDEDLAHTIADTLHGHAYITRGDVGRVAHVIRQALEAFSAMVAAAEREACAKVCDGVGIEYHDAVSVECGRRIRKRRTT